MSLYPVSERGRRARRWLLLVAVLAWASAYGKGAAAIAAPAPAPVDVVPGEALVRFEPGTPDVIRETLHASVSARVLSRIEAIGFDVVALPSAGLLDAYRAHPAVAVAEPNLRGRIALSPDDACFSGAPCAGIGGQWHLAMTNAPFAWDEYPANTFDAAAKRSAERVTIAVLDTKIDASHPDFANAGSSSTDARDGGQIDLSRARDIVTHHTGAAAYHGTFVAGLAAAATGNGRDTAALGYAATILPVTVVNGAGNTDAAALAEGIVYAWEQGARVINLSLGIAGDSTAVRNAIRLVTRGTATRPPSLVVAAAGNNTGSAPFYPGSYPEVMSVSGTDADDRPAPCSNHNANVSVSAPADRLIGLDRMPNRLIQAACGTSAAAPQVSGLAALLLAQDPSRTPTQVRAIIEQTADDLGPSGRDDRFGHGRINAERALRAHGPRVRDVTGTVVIASGGQSTLTATVTSPGGVDSAELVFDRPDATPVRMAAADGTFGGTAEVVRATVTIPAGVAGGAHPVWVRAFDGTSWSAHAVGVIAVDAKAPTITGEQATSALRATGQPLIVRFSLADDYAKSLHWGVQFYNGATGRLVHQDYRTPVTAGPQEYRWLPDLAAPGGPPTQ